MIRSASTRTSDPEGMPPMNEDRLPVRREPAGEAWGRLLLPTLAVGVSLAMQLAAVPTVTLGDWVWGKAAPAQTITTDTKGLVAGEVKVPAGYRDTPACRAMPAKDGPFP